MNENTANLALRGITWHDLPDVPTLVLSKPKVRATATFPVEEYGAEADFSKQFVVESMVSPERIMEDHIKHALEDEARKVGSTDIYVSKIDVKPLPPPMVDPDEFYTKRAVKYRATCRVAFVKR